MKKKLLALTLVLTAFSMPLAAQAFGPIDPTPGHPGHTTAAVAAGPIDPTPGHPRGNAFAASEFWSLLLTIFNL